MKKITLVSALICAAGATQAAERPEWNQLSVSYQSSDYDYADDSLDGFGLSGSALVSEHVFIAAGFSRASEEYVVFGESVDVDYDSTSLGLGFRSPLSDNTDFFGAVSYEKLDVSFSYMGDSGSEDENGYGLTGGLRSMLTESLEIYGALNYIDIADESDTGVGIGADYYLTPNFALGVGYSTADDVDTTSASLTLVF